MKTQRKELTTAWQISLLTLFVAMFIMLPDMAFAANNDYKSSGETVLSNLFCNVISWFTGATGKGIATIAIIVIGVGALMGKVSWGMAIIVGIGVALIFGAAGLVNNIAGDQADDNKCGKITSFGATTTGGSSTTTTTTR